MWDAIIVGSSWAGLLTVCRLTRLRPMWKLLILEEHDSVGDHLIDDDFACTELLLPHYSELSKWCYREHIEWQVVAHPRPIVIKDILYPKRCRRYALHLLEELRQAHQAAIRDNKRVVDVSLKDFSYTSLGAVETNRLEELLGLTLEGLKLPDLKTLQHLCPEQSVQLSWSAIISHLGDLFQDNKNIKIETNTRISSIRLDKNHWQVETSYDGIMVEYVAPQVFLATSLSDLRCIMPYSGNSLFDNVTIRQHLRIIATLIETQDAKAFRSQLQGVTYSSQRLGKVYCIHDNVYCVYDVQGTRVNDVINAYKNPLSLPIEEFFLAEFGLNIGFKDKKIFQWEESYLANETEANNNDESGFEDKYVQYNEQFPYNGLYIVGDMVAPIVFHNRYEAATQSVNSLFYFFR